MLKSDNFLHNRGQILTVDDDASTLFIISSQLEEMGFDVLKADHGEQALQIIQQNHTTLNAIILDKNMPHMNGIEVIHHLKKNPQSRHIPIIMLTGANTPEDIKQGIDAGVFYYITKPWEDHVFHSIVEAAYKESQRRQLLQQELIKHHTGFKVLTEAKFSIQTLIQAESLACFIAHCFPTPEKALPGLAALLINSIEHGNLNIGYEEKTRLITQNQWKEEIKRRETLNENANKKVFAHLKAAPEQTSITIQDAGEGFNWKKYMDIDPARALDSHGRGIAQANKISFDELSYNQEGNCVTAISYAHTQFNW